MSIFGTKVAVVYVLLGLVIAVVGGTLIEKLHLENQVEEFIRNAKQIDIPQEELMVKERIKYAWEQVVETFKKVFPYILVGVGIGAFIHNWIPEDVIVSQCLAEAWVRGAASCRARLSCSASTPTA